MKKPVGGVEVPDYPVAAPGYFYSADTWANPWYGLLTQAAFESAIRAQVFDVERKGSRGGKHYAVHSREVWLAWVTVYKQRVQTRLNGEVARRLGYDGRFSSK